MHIFHKWTKWEQEVNSSKGRDVLVQFRECTKCGFTQAKAIKV